MIEMFHGETTIKVMRDRVAEMERKGWRVVGQDQEQDDTLESEDLEDGDSYGL